MLWESDKIVSLLTKHSQEIEYDYVIEKDSIIQGNFVFFLLNDKNIWNLDKDPMVPNLNYWLTNDGKFVHNANSVPFGVGIRECFGQALAIKEIEAFLGNLLLKYKIVAENNDTESIELKYTFGEMTHSIITPKPVEIEKRVF